MALHGLVLIDLYRLDVVQLHFKIVERRKLLAHGNPAATIFDEIPRLALRIISLNPYLARSRGKIVQKIVIMLVVEFFSLTPTCIRDPAISGLQLPLRPGTGICRHRVHHLFYSFELLQFLFYTLGVHSIILDRPLEILRQILIILVIDEIQLAAIFSACGLVVYRPRLIDNFRDLIQTLLYSAVVFFEFHLHLLLNPLKLHFEALIHLHQLQINIIFYFLHLQAYLLINNLVDDALEIGKQTKLLLHTNVPIPPQIRRGRIVQRYDLRG